MKCRACGSEKLIEVLDMGRMPLAGDFNAGSAALRYPLAIDCCEVCTLLQVRELVPHEVIFNKDYCYASSTVPALVEHFKELAASMPITSNVLDIGCNDGPLLRPLIARGMKAVGVDASQNVVDLAIQAGCTAYCDTFNRETAKKALDYNDGEKYNVVTCSNVFAHNPDLDSMMDGIKQVLKYNGTLILEVHDAQALHEKLQWDCFYHEHCFYWSPLSLHIFLKRQGFTILGTELTSMHGGALRVYASNCTDSSEWTATTANLDVDKWRSFGDRAKRSRDALNALITDISYRGAVSLLGAAGRAAVLVNWAGIGYNISAAYDGAPLRIGKQLPGTPIPILDERLLLNPPPAEYGSGHCWCLLGAWHLKDALVKKFATPYRHFISPLPNATFF